MSTKTQLESWLKTLADLGPRQREVLACLQVNPRGLSAWEISDITRRLVHAVRPRLGELRDLGLIKESGRRFEERTQRHELVYVALVPVSREDEDPDGQRRFC